MSLLLPFVFLFGIPQVSVGDCSSGHLAPRALSSRCKLPCILVSTSLPSCCPLFWLLAGHTGCLHSLILGSSVVLFCCQEDASPQGWRVGRGRVTALGLLISLQSLPIVLAASGVWVSCGPAVLAMPSLIMLLFRAFVPGWCWKGVRGLTPISRASSHQLCSATLHGAQSLKHHQKIIKREREAAHSFPLPTNSNGAGVMGSHQHWGSRRAGGPGSAIWPLDSCSLGGSWEGLPAPVGVTSSEVWALSSWSWQALGLLWPLRRSLCPCVEQGREFCQLCFSRGSLNPFCLCHLLGATLSSGQKWPCHTGNL